MESGTDHLENRPNLCSRSHARGDATPPVQAPGFQKEWPDDLEGVAADTARAVRDERKRQGYATQSKIADDVATIKKKFNEFGEWLDKIIPDWSCWLQGTPEQFVTTQVAKLSKDYYLNEEEQARLDAEATARIQSYHGASIPHLFANHAFGSWCRAQLLGDHASGDLSAESLLNTFPAQIGIEALGAVLNDRIGKIASESIESWGFKIHLPEIDQGALLQDAVRHVRANLPKNARSRDDLDGRIQSRCDESFRGVIARLVHESEAGWRSRGGALLLQDQVRPAIVRMLKKRGLRDDIEDLASTAVQHLLTKMNDIFDPYEMPDPIKLALTIAWRRVKQTLPLKPLELQIINYCQTMKTDFGETTEDSIDIQTFAEKFNQDHPNTKITENDVKRALNKHQFNSPISLDTEAGAIAAAADHRDPAASSQIESHCDMLPCLHTLDQAESECLRLYYFECYKQTDIATKLNISVSTVYRKMTSGKVKLKENLRRTDSAHPRPHRPGSSAKP